MEEAELVDPAKQPKWAVFWFLTTGLLAAVEEEVKVVMARRVTKKKAMVV